MFYDENKYYFIEDEHVINECPDPDFCADILNDAMVAILETGNLIDLIDAVDTLAREYNDVGCDLPRVTGNKIAVLEKNGTLFSRFAEFTKNYAKSFKKGV